MDNVKVKIFKSGYIPGIGTGPIRTPTWISRPTYEKLKGLGFNIIIVEDPAANDILTVKNNANKEVVTTTTVSKPKTPSVEVKKAEDIPVIKEEPVVTTEDTAVEEETILEESNDEVSTNDKDLSADAIYTEDFLTSKNICKKILNARKIQYNYHALYETLKQLVLDSNPKN